MVGIIDIGTNTLRLVTYQNGKIDTDIAVASEIVRDTIEGKITDSGIEYLCDAINFLLSKTDVKNIYIIATEAIRNLKNKEEVKEIVYKKTNIHMDILSGEEEAEYVFCGAIKEIEEKKGTIMDLGGGSTEIIGFSDKEIKYLKSLPCGCKKVKNKFSIGCIPTDDEIKIIENNIEEQIEKINTDGKLYMVGGTAKTVLKLNNYLCKEDRDYIKTDEIKEVLNFIREKNEEELKEIFKVRYNTIAVGTVIMKKIAKICDKEEIYVRFSGVREGYIIKKEMNG